MEKCYIIIEACYHAAYLIEKLADLLTNDPSQFSLIIRQKKKLNPNQLAWIHNKLHSKKQLSAPELTELNNSYDGLSQAELALITMYGVPRLHVFSFTHDYLCADLNNNNLENFLRKKSMHTSLSAVIFLDCILTTWWLDVFANRIVNAHSAVLPHARGMYAIEQVVATQDRLAVTRCAGASIHYINQGIDTGPIIMREQLQHVWQYESIWHVKAASYILAFALLNDYIRKPNAFTHNDILQHQDPLGPEYKAKDFSTHIQKIAEINYARYRAMGSKASL